MQDNPSKDAKLFHEDLVIDKAIPLGRKLVTKEEIIAWGRAFDPQPMHVDEEAAKATLVGGLCASGWHTCAMAMRMVSEAMLNRVASLGSPGIDEVRWMVPVRPGDELRAVYTVKQKRDLASRPDVGICKVLVELLNQKDETVSTWLTNQLTRRRDPGPPQPERRSKRAPATQSLWDDPGTAVAARADAYFEDRRLGELTDFGAHTFTRPEIIDFARQFDPQPFHLNEVAAKASLFGGLCASGWHTAAFFIRGAVVARLAGNAARQGQRERLPVYGPSPGFRNLAWPKPVFVGDTIEYRGRLAQKIDLRSRPQRGLLVTETQARNQKGEIVMTVTTQVLAERRRPLAAE